MGSSTFLDVPWAVSLCFTCRSAPGGGPHAPPCWRHYTQWMFARGLCFFLLGFLIFLFAVWFCTWKHFFASLICRVSSLNGNSQFVDFYFCLSTSRVQWISKRYFLRRRKKCLFCNNEAIQRSTRRIRCRRAEVAFPSDVFRFGVRIPSWPIVTPLTRLHLCNHLRRRNKTQGKCLSRKSLLLLYIVTRNSGAEIVIWVRCDIWYFGHDKLFISLQYVIWGVLHRNLLL